jgi:uncharacterized protein YhaN
MRFQRLDLIKFGKFTDRRIDFPAATRDFHLIVGSNEAGKSTMRSAILDLLFGIPARSPHGFRHALSELRLGARIDGAPGPLEFHRTKAQKQTLRTPADAVLLDAALAPYLGVADRTFFDQMFGLDHTRLVAGGNSILSAADDVGQVLFQSAAGVASLGKVRDKLMEEADGLWGQRKSASRVYFAAQERLEAATTALKEATVRTKVWSDANGRVETLRTEMDQARAALAHLQGARSRLERVRRLAPFLQTLRTAEGELAVLGDVVDLPADADALMTAAERNIADATQLLGVRNEEAETAEAELAKLRVDTAVLAVASEIVALEEQRVRYAPYPQDIDRRQREVAMHWQAAREACAQLGWPAENEAAIAARLPRLLVRRELSRLARDFSGLRQQAEAGAAAVEAKRAEIASLITRLEALPAGEVKPGLRAALSSARAAGDTASATRTLALALVKVQAALEAALGSLGVWRRDADALAGMALPTPAAVARQVQTRQALVAKAAAGRASRDAQAGTLAKAELEAKQFTERHHPVTQAMVDAVRLDRNRAWHALRSGATPLAEGAENFEVAMGQADRVVDTRVEKVGESTQFQALQQQVDRERQALALLERQCVQDAEALANFDAGWSAGMERAGLPGMPVDDLADWLARRGRALEAAAAAWDAQANARAHEERVSALVQGLVAAMRDAGLTSEGSAELSGLCAVAEAWRDEIDKGKVRREAIAAQREEARVSLGSLEQAAAKAGEALQAWHAAWAAALERNGLPAGSDPDSVEGALELIGSIEEMLANMRQKRTERIDTMNADLQRFEKDAADLAARIAPDLSGAAAALIAQSLATRLSQAREAQAESTRLKEVLRVARERVAQARESIQRAEASLAPLKARAGVDAIAGLRPLIERSDRKRELVRHCEVALASLIGGGDGLSRAEIEAEIEQTDLSQLAAELARTEMESNEAVQQQTSVAADLAEAGRVLSAIGGSDAAAKEESRRQEALAQMADAAERYVKVYTAARLLRWAIERYREEKQGPLLRRAGEVFSALTLGSFARLVVDFDRDPMVLEGLRADGERVGIDGMSDGTRDQLYLALRLAALELHIGQATPLPFVADDLFINYDDDRSKAGLQALAELSEKTQVIFLSHHDHLIPAVREVFGADVNVTVL